MKSVLAFLPFFLFTPAVLSQQSAVRQEIVVTAAALPETIETTPAAVTVIDRDEIERREARDVGDLLREVPGVAVSRTGSAGKAAQIFIRGGSTKQALVLWNGVEMNNPYFSGYNFGQLSTAGVERVEVVRGPFSALYGSEAVSGVVNVLTTPERGGGVLDVSVGERGLLNASAAGSLVEDRWNAHAAAERRQDDGFAANDEFRSTSLLGGATFEVSDRLSIGLLARHSDYDLGIPFSPNGFFTEFVPTPSRGETGSESQVALPLRFAGGGVAWELRVAESRRHDEFEDPDGAFGPESSITDARVRNARGAASTKTRIGTLTVGAEAGRDRVDHSSNYAEIDSRERTSESFFVEDRFSSRGFELSAGLRYDRYDSFGSEISPRLAAAWLGGGHKVRAAYGEAFRAPAIGELYFPFGGNRELGPERSRNLEVGYDLFAKPGTLSVTLFHAKYDGLIVFGSTGKFENVAAATARGLELALSRDFGAVDLSASYTWLDTEDDASGDALLRRPRHSGSLALGYGRGAYDAEVVLIHKGARADITDLFPFGVVRNDAYTTADLTLRHRRGALVPYLKLENLTDERYEEVYGYRSPGRRAVVGVRYAVR